MSTFVEYVTEVLSPPRLRGIWGTKWVTAFAEEYDWQKNRLEQSIVARFAQFAPEDGLSKIGWERQIERAPGEPPGIYATRLGAAWDTWKWAGTGPGILAGIASCGIPSFNWGAGSDWPTDWPSSSGVVWLLSLSKLRQVPSGTSQQFARFWVIIDYYAMSGGIVTYPYRGSRDLSRGKWGARGMLDPYLPNGQWRAIKNSIRKWRGQGETCVAVIVCLSPNSVADIRAPLWRRGTGTIRGGGHIIKAHVGEKGHKVQ